MASFWAAYSASLVKRPVLTKMAAGGVIWSTGDCIAQQLIEGKGSNHDFVRTGRIGVYGTFVHAPLLHWWYGKLNAMKFGGKTTTFVGKLAVDAIIWGPFTLSMFFTCSTLLEGRSLQEGWEKVKIQTIPTAMRGFFVFTPAQVINLLFVPLENRVAVMQVVGLGWSSYLSYVNQRAEMRVRAAHQQQQILGAGKVIEANQAATVVV